MSFGSDGANEVLTMIKDTCKRLGLTAQRADDVPGSEVIMDAVTRLIERAQFLIFDLTHARPNVYYELGYAHGVGNSGRNILLIAQKDAPLHFNASGFAVRQYKSLEHLPQVLEEHLAKMVKR